MKKALFVTYDFPPCSAVGAAIRSLKLAEYLPDFGWEAFVISRGEGHSAAQPASAKLIRVPAGIPPRVSYQLGAWVWAARILPHARGLIRELRPDLIYASCPPFPHALSALRLARESGLPLVVDFRDSWSLDPHAGGSGVKRAAKRFLTRRVYPRLERKVLASADAILTNSPSMHNAYVEMVKDPAERIHLIPNGFDEKDFCEPVSRPLRERPLLLYCGRFGAVGGRSPDLLLRAVRRVIDAGRPIDFEILGDVSPRLLHSTRRLEEEGFVRTRAPVPHAEAIRAMREADILVVYQAPSTTSITPVAGKTYEYLRTGRPILAVVPPGDNAGLVQRYATQSAVVTVEDDAAIAAAIHQLLDRLDTAASTEPAPGFLDLYSRRRTAERIAEVFEQVTSSPKTQ